MGRHTRPRMPSGFRSVRDMLTATLGAAGIVWETVVTGDERPTLLIIFAGLLGLPLVFREQDKAKDRRDREDNDQGGAGDSGT